MAGEGGGDSGRGSCGGSEYGGSSPRSNRFKFLCSHGGKILPRPADGYLKYVGGETRVISLSRTITFSELMKRLTAMFDGDMVLKYQLITEDLDALVSVRSDEDLKHMLDEYDRQENEGSSRLRTFLFPSKPVMIENQTPMLEHHMLEQRYIDAINGIIRLLPKFHPQQQLQQQILPPTMTLASSPMSSFSIPSACSSPQSASPEHHALGVDMSMGTHRFTLPPSMHKVQSSPSLCGLQQTYQGHVHGRPHYPTYHQNHHHLQHQSSFSARAHHRGIRTPPPLSSPGRSEPGSMRSSMMGTAGTGSHGQNHYNNSKPPSGNNSPRSLGRQSGGGGGGGGGGCCGKCGYYDTCPSYACNRNMDRADHSLPQSPR